MEDLPLPMPFDAEHALPPFDSGPPKKRSRKPSSDEDFIEAATPAAPSAAEQYSTPLDIEPCGVRQMEEYVALLEVELQEIIRTKQLEIAYARGRIEAVRQEQRHNRKRCNAEGCTNIAMRGGVCTRHGATKIRHQCRTEGCILQAQGGGVCYRHGARQSIPKICKVEGCNSKSNKFGVCGKHRPGRAECTVEGCKFFTDSGGACGMHGRQSGQIKRRRYERKDCSVEGCTAKAKLASGVCQRHREGRAECTTEGCTLFTDSGGACGMHGGNPKWRAQYRKECSAEGCTNCVVKGGVCKRHGAKVNKPCKLKGCHKIAQSLQNGFCKKHFDEYGFTSEGETCPEVATAKVKQKRTVKAKSTLDSNVEAETELAANVEWI